MADLDHFDADPPENATIFEYKSVIFINHTSEYQIPELGRHIDKTVQWNKDFFLVILWI